MTAMWWSSSPLDFWRGRRSIRHAGVVADLLVEIHVPLTPSHVPAGEYPFPWIDSVMEYLFELDGSKGEMYDDGEEWGHEYLSLSLALREMI